MKHWLIALSFIFFSLQSISQMETSTLADSEKSRFLQMKNYDLQSVSSNNFDVGFYRCNWVIDPAVRFISGSVTSWFTITSATNTIIFDLTKVLTVDSVLYHGNKINFTHTSNNALEINFPSTLAQGSKDSVSIFYNGIPPLGSFSIAQHSGVPVLWTLSEPYGARTWWPCKDMLRDKADSIEIRITTPLVYTSSSNGLPVNEVVGGATKTTTWKCNYPIVSYLVAIAVTNYTVTSDIIQTGGKSMPLVLYSYPESTPVFLAAHNTAEFCLEKFPPLITEYPFVKERYAQTQFNQGGGMEHQTNSYISNAGSGLVAHELAHQWFGDKVTCGSWTNIWLNEGFASYMEYVFVELNNPSNKLPFLTSSANYITSNPGGSVHVPDTTNVGRIFDYRLSYKKGSYLLHMLRWKMGDSSFFRGVRRYINDPALAYKTAMTSDLQRNLEEESGLQLTEFFNDWYYGQGYPVYSIEWSQKANNHLRLKINQTSSHASVGFFEMPVPVLFRNATRDTIVTFDHTKNGQLFAFDPGFIVDTVIIDPEWWILTRNKLAQKVAFVPPSELLIYPNPSVGQLSVEFPAGMGGNFRVDVFNSLGQRVYEENISIGSGSLLQINTSPWASGIYYLRLTGSGNFRIVKKLVVGR